MQGTVVSIDVAAGDAIQRGQQLVVLESMKMEHVLVAATGGVVTRITATIGETVQPGDRLVFVDEHATATAPAATAADAATVDLDLIRADLAEVRERHALGLDAARPEAVERRRATKQRTTRENVDDLVDPGSFVEYGPLVIAAQRRRRELDDLIR
ncbi:MAG: hypothetical protein QOJ67_1878, partial [Acidimicrobiaceae bacterium]